MQTCYLVAQIGIIPLAILSAIIIIIDVPKFQRTCLYQNENLLLVQVLFANGQQETQPFLPTSPGDSDIFWLNESSILSLQGQKNLYKLGSKLKYMFQYYFQARNFHYDIVESTTGNLNILQTGLQCLHAGMFPTVGTQIIHMNIAWRPIPYNVLPKVNDDLIYQRPLLEDIRQIKLSDSETKLCETLEKVREILNFKVSLSDMVMINEYLNYEALFHELPEKWTNNIWPNNSQALVDYFWSELTKHSKTYAVPLLKLFLKNIHKKMAGELPDKRILHLYAGQALNIDNILTVLGDWSLKNGSITPASYILIEFVQEIKTKFYKIYLYYGTGKNLENPTQLKPKECNFGACTIYEFTKLVNSLTLG